ncbi:unnamed protein product, partial [Meganyctiphanes norvegica]
VVILGTSRIYNMIKETELACKSGSLKKNTEHYQFEETKKMPPNLKLKCQPRKLKLKPMYSTQKRKRATPEALKHRPSQELKLIKEKLKRKETDTLANQDSSEVISASKRRLLEEVTSNRPNLFHSQHS